MNDAVIGKNNGHWNMGIRVGGGEGGFLTFDGDDVPCDCGWGYGMQGDIGDIENIGITMNQSQSEPLTMSIDYTDPNGITWSWSPLEPEAPVQPSMGIGAGFFAGVGYDWCF